MSDSDSVRQPDGEATPPVPDLHVEFLDPIAFRPTPPLSEDAIVLEEIVADATTPEPPRPGFGFAVLWCLFFVAVTQLVPGLIAGMLLIVMVGISPQAMERLNNTELLQASPEYAQAMLIAMLLSQVASVLSGVLVIRAVVGRSWPRILALRSPSLPHFVLAVLGLPGLIVIAMGVEGVVKQVLPSVIDLEETMKTFGKWPWPIGVLIIGLGPGLGEELWCRGFLGRGLVGRHGYLGGLLLTSLLFGLIHLEPTQVVYTMVMGTILHASYLASRSLLIPMFLHAANNSLAILMLHVPSAQDLVGPGGVVPWYVVAGGMLLLIAVGWAFFKSRARLVDLPIEGASPWRPFYPGVAYPPPRSCTKVAHPTPDLTAWTVVAGAVLLFVGTTILAASEGAGPP